VALCGSVDEEIAERSIDCLFHFAAVPLAHRSERYISKPSSHSHRNAQFFPFLSELLEASRCLHSFSWKTILSESFVLPEEMTTKELSFPFPVPVPVSGSGLGANSGSDTIIVHSKFSSADQRTVAEIVASTEEQTKTTASSSLSFSAEKKTVLAWMIRFRRLSFTAAGRKKLLSFQLKLAMILLTHPERSFIFKVFTDRLIKDLVWLVAGSASPDTETERSSASSNELLEERVLAIQCLATALDARDSSSPPLLLHFPWILDDLGVSRGQYMGVIPSLIRFSVSWIISLREKEKENHQNNRNGSPFSSDDLLILRWVENLFFLVAMIMNIPSALPALADNGFVQSFLTILRSNGREKHSSDHCTPQFVFIDTLCMDILVNSFRNFPSILKIFKENSGIEIITTRVRDQMGGHLRDFDSSTSFDGSSSSSTYNPATSEVAVVNRLYLSKLLIQYQLTMLTSYIQECRNDFMTGEEQQFTEFYQSKELVTVIETILQRFETFTPFTLSLIYSMITEMINKDPSPPTILNYLLSSTAVIKYGLAVFEGNDKKPISLEDELQVGILSFLSTISITKDGLALAGNSPLINRLFALYLDPSYYHPRSSDLMGSDVSITFGKHLEQLIRHYPETFQTTILGSLTQTLNTVLTSVLSYCNENDLKLCFDEEFGRMINSTMALMTCLEQLLERKPTINEFITNHDGIQLLFKMKVLSLGPARFFLVSAASNQAIQEELSSTSGAHSSSSATFLGYPPLDSIIVRCFERIASYHEPKSVLESSWSFFEELKGKLDSSLTSYWEFLSSENDSGEGAITEKGKKRKRNTRQSEDEDSDRDNRGKDHPGRKTLTTASSTASSKVAPFLDSILDTVSGVSMENYLTADELPSSLVHFAKILRLFSLLSFCVELMGVSFSSNHTRPGRPSAANYESFKQLVSSESRMAVLRTFLFSYYYPTQEEVARVLANETAEKIHQLKETASTKVSPNYVLRVLHENLLVRDSFEDPGKKLFKLPKGLHVLSTERKLAPNASVLKYHLSEGWVSAIRGSSIMNLSQPQVIVLDIAKKSSTEEVSVDSMEVTATSKQSYSRLNVLSARRSGLQVFQFFHKTVKHVFFTMMPKLLRVHETTDQDPLFLPRSSADQPISPSLPSAVCFFLEFFDRLFPEKKSTKLFSMSEYLREQEQQMNSSSSALARQFPDSSSFIDHFIAKEFVVAFPAIPTLEQVSLMKCQSICRIFDLFQSVISDNKQSPLFPRGSSRQEVNCLFLIRMFYEKQLFLRVMEVSTEVFLCSLDYHLEDKSHSPPLSLVPELIDSLDERFPGVKHCKTVDELFEVVSGKLNEFEDLIDESKMPGLRELFENRKKYLERRKIAMSSLPRLIDMWKQFFTAIHCDKSRSDCF
jgi:hypothetical protein